MKKQKPKMLNQKLKRLMPPSYSLNFPIPLLKGLVKVVIVWVFTLLFFWLWSCFWVISPDRPTGRSTKGTGDSGKYDPEKVDKQLKKLSEFSLIKAEFSTNLRDKGGMVRSSPAMNTLRTSFQEEYKCLGTVRSQAEGGCYYWIVYQSSDKYVVIAEPKTDLLRNDTCDVSNIKWRFIPGHRDSVRVQVLDDQRAKECASILARYEKDYVNAEKAIIKLFSEDFIGALPRSIDDMVIDAYVRISDNGIREKKFGTLTPSQAALTSWLNEGRNKVDQYEWSLYHNADETFYLLCSKDGEPKALYNDDAYVDDRTRITQLLAEYKLIEEGKAWGYWVPHEIEQGEPPPTEEPPEGGEPDNEVMVGAYQQLMNPTSRQAQFGDKTPSSGDLTRWLNTVMNVKDCVWSLYYDVNDTVHLLYSKNNELIALYTGEKVVVGNDLSKLITHCDEVQPNKVWEYWKEKVVPPTSLNLVVEDAYSRLEKVVEREKKFGTLTPSQAALTSWLNEGRNKVDQYDWSLYHNADETFYLLCSKDGEPKALYNGDEYVDDRTRIAQLLAEYKLIEEGKAWGYWVPHEIEQGEPPPTEEPPNGGGGVPPDNPPMVEAYQLLMNTTRRQAQFGDLTPSSGDLTRWLNSVMNVKDCVWSLYYDVNDTVYLLCSKNNELIALHTGEKVVFGNDLSKLITHCDEVQPNKVWEYWKEKVVPPTSLNLVIEDAYSRLDTVVEREKKFGTLTPSQEALTSWLNEGRNKVDQYEWSLYHNADETFYLLCSKDGEPKALYNGDEYVDDRIRIAQLLAEYKLIEEGKAWDYWVPQNPEEGDDSENGENPPKEEPPEGGEPGNAVMVGAYQQLMNPTSRQAQFGDKTPSSGDLTRWLNSVMNVKDCVWSLYYDVNDTVHLLYSKNNELIALYTGEKVVVGNDLSKLITHCDEVQPNKVWEYWKEKVVPPTSLNLVIEDAYSRLDTVVEREKKFGTLTPSQEALTSWLNEGRNKVDQYEWSLYHNADETFYLLCSKDGEPKALYNGDEYVDDRTRITQLLAEYKLIEEGKAWDYWVPQSPIVENDDKGGQVIVEITEDGVFETGENPHTEEPQIGGEPDNEVMIGAYQQLMNTISRQVDGDKTPSSGDLTRWLNTMMNVKDCVWSLYYDVNDTVYLLCSKNNELIALHTGEKVVFGNDLSKLITHCDEVQPNKVWEYWKEKVVPPTSLNLVIEDAYSRLDTVVEREKKFGTLTPSQEALTSWLNEGRNKVDQYEWSLYHNADETFYLLCSKDGEPKALYNGDEYVDDRTRITQLLAEYKLIEEGNAWEYWIECDE